jgi:hypothetical protein
MKRWIVPLTAALALVVVGFVAEPSLAQEPARCSIRGSVVAPSGQPLASLWVILERDGTESGRALTDDTGRYSISHLRSGRFRLLVQQGRVALFTAQVHLPEDSQYHVVLP